MGVDMGGTSYGIPWCGAAGSAETGWTLGTTLRDRLPDVARKRSARGGGGCAGEERCDQLRAVQARAGPTPVRSVLRAAERPTGKDAVWCSACSPRRASSRAAVPGAARGGGGVRASVAPAPIGCSASSGLGLRASGDAKHDQACGVDRPGVDPRELTRSIRGPRPASRQDPAQDLGIRACSCRRPQRPPQGTRGGAGGAAGTVGRSAAYSEPPRRPMPPELRVSGSSAMKARSARSRRAGSAQRAYRGVPGEHEDTGPELVARGAGRRATPPPPPPARRDLWLCGPALVAGDASAIHQRTRQELRARRRARSPR